MDLPLSQDVDLTSYGARGILLKVQSANTTSGIQYQVTDTTRTVPKAVRGPSGTTFKQVYVSSVKNLPMAPSAIAGTTKSGTLIFDEQRVQVYVLTDLGIPQNHCRLMMITRP